MKEKIYTLECEDCEQELAEGTYKEVIGWVQDECLDEKNIDSECAEDLLLRILCTDCARNLS